jgi:hypothetical protein
LEAWISERRLFINQVSYILDRRMDRWIYECGIPSNGKVIVLKKVQKLFNDRALVGPWSHEWPDIAIPGP